MKKLLLLPALLLAVSGWAADSEAFDPKAPVSLDLREAPLIDVISTLGAMANLPVVIEPGIEGKVTIKLEGVPFVKILAMLSRDNGISVRVEDGKLVASRVREAAAVAPVLPEKFRDAPRILLADYASAAANPPPLLISTTWNGEEVCSIAKIGKEGGGLLEIPLSKTGGPESLVVADMGYDPVLKTRTIALETADGSVKYAYCLAANDTPISLHKERSLRLLVSQSPRLVARFLEKGDCGQLVFQPVRGGASVTVAIEAAAHSEEVGASTPLFAPRVQTTAGTVFKALGSEADSGSGLLRGYAVTGYVSRDGRSVALAFKARAIWTDPEDGRQYYFTQAGRHVGFHQLLKYGFILNSFIQPGVATPYALDVRVSGSE
jgi:hypothetical protein